VTQGGSQNAALSPAPLAAEPFSPVMLTAMDRLSSAAEPPPRGVALVLAWVATLVILVAAAVAVVIWREQIVQAWPASARLLGTG